MKKSKFALTGVSSGRVRCDRPNPSSPPRKGRVKTEWWYNAKVVNSSGVHTVFYARSKPVIGSTCPGIAAPNRVISWTREPTPYDHSPAQRKLVRLHGTPAEFARAVYEAVPEFISMDEARRAVEDYNRQWSMA